MAHLARLTIESRLERLRDVRHFVHEVLQKLPDLAVDVDRAYWIVLAANEVAVNIITHAYQHNPHEAIDIEAHWAHATLRLHFYDRGIPFDLDAVPLPTFDRLSEGGFGVFIIKHVTDQFTYTRRADGQNETILAFRCKGVVSDGGSN
jgi:anti-sigma regulatory factor (Ser/Thr protein kinase)